MREIGLYIHIPFCKSKCYYCDFNSYPGREETIPAYFDALKKEIERYGRLLENYRVKTIFIGGGTPSLVDSQYITRLMNRCRQSFNIVPGAEVSIETNPGTLSFDKLVTYKASGINRLSIGLQAWQNRLLKQLGRIHLQQEFVENFTQARKVGFDNINVDLIFGLPGQTMTDWNETLCQMESLNPTHLSCYSLKIEEGTVFGRMYAEDQLIPAEDELDREMYWFAVKELEKRGLQHYEISNFSKPGFECKHNLVYWKAEEYIGVGAGAHSYLDGRRYSNIANVDQYITSIMKGTDTMENSEIIDEKGQMAEFMILGMRLIDGILLEDFKARFGVNLDDVYPCEIERLIKRQLIQKDRDRIKLTNWGLDLANEVFVEFV